MVSVRQVFVLACTALALLIAGSFDARAQLNASFSNNANCTVQVGMVTNVGTFLGPTALRNGQTWNFTIPAGERPARVFVNDASKPWNFTPGCVSISFTTFCAVNTYFLCRSGLNYSLF